MKKICFLLAVIFICVLAFADDIRLSAKAPVFVTAPADWQSTSSNSPSFRFETVSLKPPAPRNAECLISILDHDKARFTNAVLLKRILMGDSRPYLASPAEMSKLQFKELKITNGVAFYANFIDPDLAGKPVQAGQYKTATPILLSLGTNYLIKVTVFCDDLKGPDYRDAIKATASIRIKNE